MSSAILLRCFAGTVEGSRAALRPSVLRVIRNSPARSRAAWPWPWSAGASSGLRRFRAPRPHSGRSPARRPSSSSRTPSAGHSPSAAASPAPDRPRRRRTAASARRPSAAPARSAHAAVPARPVHRPNRSGCGGELALLGQRGVGAEHVRVGCRVHEGRDALGARRGEGRLGVPEVVGVGGGRKDDTDEAAAPFWRMPVGSPPCRAR